MYSFTWIRFNKDLRTFEDVLVSMGRKNQIIFTKIMPNESILIASALIQSTKNYLCNNSHTQITLPENYHFNNWDKNDKKFTS
jgi:hypothetical protein